MIFFMNPSYYLVWQYSAASIARLVQLLRPFERLKINIDCKVHYEVLHLHNEKLKLQHKKSATVPPLLTVFINYLHNKGISPGLNILHSVILNFLRNTSHLPPEHFTEVSKKYQMAEILCFNNNSLKVPNIWFIKETGMLPDSQPDLSSLSISFCQGKYFEAYVFIFSHEREGEQEPVTFTLYQVYFP